MSPLEIQQRVADLITAAIATGDPALTGLQVITESHENLAVALANALSALGFCATVCSAEGKPTDPEAEKLKCDERIVVEISRNPAICKTGRAVAALGALMKLLQGKPVREPATPATPVFRVVHHYILRDPPTQDAHALVVACQVIIA